MWTLAAQSAGGTWIPLLVVYASVSYTHLEEIAEELDMPVERVREILKISQEPVSLETPIGEEEDSHLGAVSYTHLDVYKRQVFMINRDNVDMYGTDGWQ